MFERAAIRASILWRIVEVVGAEFFAFCSFLILTRILAPEHFGVVALATMIIMIAQLILYQGVGEALVQQDCIGDDHFSSALCMNLAIAMSVASILIWTSGWIAAVLSEPQFGPVLRAIAPILLVYAASGIFQAKLRRDLNLKGFALASIFATFCGAGVAATMALMGFEIWSLVGQQWTYATVSMATFLICARWVPRPFASLEHVCELVAFSVNTAAAAFLRFSLRQADLLVLGFFVSSQQIGFYFLASRVLAMTGQLTYDSIQKIALPLLSRLQNDLDELRSAVLTTFRITCLICLPTFFGMAVTADLAIPIIFGPEWTGSVRPFQVLCVFSISYAMSLAINQVLLSLGSASMVFRLSLANAALFLVAVACAAPFGIVAAALAGGLANSFMLPAYFLSLARRLDLDLARLGKEFLSIWAAMAVMVVAMIALRQYVLIDVHPLAVLLLSIMLGTVSFCAMVTILRRDAVEQLWTIFFGQRHFFGSAGLK